MRIRIPFGASLFPVVFIRIPFGASLFPVVFICIIGKAKNLFFIEGEKIWQKHIMKEPNRM